MGKEVVMKNEGEATLADMKDVDCVVSLGGDHTFLRASSLIWDKTVPILGINTNRHAYTGALSPHFIDYSERDSHAAQLLETMEDDHFVDFEKRSRILYEKVRTRDDQAEEKALCLNEAFCAEADVASASRYRITKDGHDLGVFKSSGLIVSTGTGSSGWLYASRQFTTEQLSQIQALLGSLHNDTQTNNKAVDELNQETIFPRSDSRMYFLVREGFSMTQISEGFCTQLKITSEMLNGKVVIDAHQHINL